MNVNMKKNKNWSWAIRLQIVNLTDFFLNFSDLLGYIHVHELDH